MILIALSPRFIGPGRRLSHVTHLLLPALLLCPIMAVAEEPELTQTELESAPESRSLGDAGTALTEVERLVATLDQDEPVTELRERLDSAEQRLSAEVESRLQAMPIEQVNRSQLDSLLRVLPRFESAITEILRDLDDAIAVSDAAQEALRHTEDTWTTRLKEAAREDLSPELADLIERVIAQAAAGRQLVRGRLGDLVVVETRAREFRGKLDTLLAEASGGGVRRRDVRTQRPLARAGFSPDCARCLQPAAPDHAPSHAAQFGADCAYWRHSRQARPRSPARFGGRPDSHFDTAALPHGAAFCPGNQHDRFCCRRTCRTERHHDQRSLVVSDTGGRLPRRHDSYLSSAVRHAAAAPRVVRWRAGRHLADDRDAAICKHENS